MKRRNTFVTGFLAVLLALSATLHCEPSAKKKPITKFGPEDFNEVIKTVEKHYIDKNINQERAYTDAAVFAMMSLPNSLYLFPESYYNEREKFEEKDDIMPGKPFKISPADTFVVFEPDYKKVEEIRKNRLKTESQKPKMTNDELKNLIEREKARKSILAARWEESGFSRKDFDRVLSFIQDNLKKYKVAPIKDLQEEPEEDESQKEEYSMKDVWLAAANGFLNSLDPHSNVFLKKDWEDSIAKTLDGSFEGIGAILSGGGTRDVVVENPLEDYPAVKAGVRSGDIIQAVDGKSTKGLSLDKVVKRIKGKKGTKVSLLIKRTGIPKSFEIKVVRDKIVMKNVQSRLLKDNEHIGYIKLAGFVRSETESSEKDIVNHFRKLEEEAKKKNIKLKALVLDLRNNAGGYLDLAIDISDMFLSSGVIVSTKSPDRGESESKSAKKDNDLTDLPIVVLINAKSASASEIVASAIKDHGRGLLLGERTFGKATVQKLMDLPHNNDYVLKITQSRYYSPSGKTIQVVGVDPDIEVSAEEDGSFPFQYREENMWHHLPKISDETKTREYFNIPALKEWVKANGTAEKQIQESKQGPIKPDIQLLRAVDYVNAFITVK